ncbi:MAG TPA: HAMP domain-containing sensor histidine kinase [Candidatus Limnocylindrales bacterium]|nr:HAMP domain-containing sensor histidine kinase [Candidatus Limnocylindrales bacterium]
MSALRGVRGRLTITIVALVALTATLLGVASYVFVDYSLHDRFQSDAANQARFDLSVLIPQSLPEITRGALNDSRLQETFQRRDVVLAATFGGDVTPQFAPLLSPEFNAAVDRGELGYQWLTLAGQPTFIVGGNLPETDATFYFLHDVTSIEAALSALRIGLVVGSIILIVVALIAARYVARGVLAPVDAASRAAERIERGDLGARVPVTSDDEFGDWAETFNRMAASLETTIDELEDAQAHNRRFVADVSHELRTPLAALVAEASMLREGLDELPDGSRRAGELLVADVGRLRVLVDDLMEISRFDAGAEQVVAEQVDLVRLVTAVIAARMPEAIRSVPPNLVLVESDPRRIERIVGNLLDNAREHASGAPVEVSLRLGKDLMTVIVTVADRGPGIPEDRLPHVFDRFYKADPSRSAGSSGLGLAIAAEHARLLGGELGASNRDGGGARFELRLPVTRPLPGGDLPAIGEGEDQGQEPAAKEPSR